MLSSATKKKIDTARDMLVGKIPMPTSQVEQITLALIYKFMSDMDKKTKDLGDTSGFFANGYEKYAWDHLMDKSLPARDRVLLYREALEKMALNPHIPQLFRDIFRNASLPFNDPETLKMFLEVINQFEYDHSEELGNAFEYLLQVMGSQGDAGQFRTPRHIIDFIVEVVDPMKTDKILDPACGTAGFLISAYNHLRKNGLTNDEMDQVSANFVGYDISQDMQRLSLVNMYLHHFPDPHIYEYDSLSSEDRWNDDFDVILANPPFMTPKGGIRPHNRFSVPSNRAEVLFVDYIMEHLTINGKAGVIVPEGITFQSQNAYKDLRKMMVDDDYLWAVVSLPAGIFQPYSGVKTSILLFDRKIAKKTNEILFVKIGNDGFDLGAQRRPIAKNDISKITSVLLDFKSSLQNDIEYTVTNTDSSRLVGKNEIRKNDYNFDSNRYAERKVTNSSFPMVKLEEVLDYVQPTKYLVESVEYDNSYKTPVLTAGKTFLLGYTNESHGIYNDDLPVIIFDDFTTATQLVDFPFKVKSSALKILKGKKEIANIRYLYYITKVIEFDSSNHKRYWISQYSQLEIPLPPLSVQQEIVEELDRYQKIIDGAKQVVENYKPSFKIENAWDHVPLSEICELSTGTTPSTTNSSYYVGSNPFIKTAEIDNCVITKASTHISDEALSDYSLKVFPPGTILMAMYGQGKTRGKVGLLEISATTTQNAAAIKVRNKNTIKPEFLYYYLLGQYENLRDHGIEGHISHLNIKLLSTFKVPVPPIEDQETIVKKLMFEADVFSQFLRVAKDYEMRIRNRVNEIWGK